MLHRYVSAMPAAFSQNFIKALPAAQRADCAEGAIFSHAGGEASRMGARFAPQTAGALRRVITYNLFISLNQRQTSYFLP